MLGPLVLQGVCGPAADAALLVLGISLLQSSARENLGPPVEYMAAGENGDLG